MGGGFWTGTLVGLGLGLAALAVALIVLPKADEGDEGFAAPPPAAPLGENPVGLPELTSPYAPADAVPGETFRLD